MSLALVLDEAPDDTLKDFYIEKDGKFHLDVTGIEDTDKMRIELATVKREAAERRKAAKDLEERYAGIDIEKVKEMMARLDKDGEAKLLAEGKIDEVFNNRTKKMREDLQRQIDDAQSKAIAAESKTKQYSQRVLDDRIRDAVTGKVHASAVKSGDVLRAAREKFTLNENGDAVQLDSDGNIVLGKDGKTPYSPAEWLENMEVIAPHWFPANASGGGANGSSGSTVSKTMKRAQFESLQDRDKSAAAKQYQIID